MVTEMIVERSGVFYIVSDFILQYYPNDIESRASHSSTSREELEKILPFYNEFCDLAAVHSDMYKDAYGFRPRICMDCSTVENTKSAIKYLTEDMAELSETININIAEEKLAQAAATESFEGLVKMTMEVTRSNRLDAIRYIQQANNADSFSELEFVMNIPFHYIQKTTEGVPNGALVTR